MLPVLLGAGTWVSEPFRVITDFRRPSLLVGETKRANLVSSLTQRGMHAPVIDIDIPIRLVPSKTEGHSHLDIEREMSWHGYVDLLDALAKHEIIEWNYVNFTEHRGMSFVRLHPERRPARPKKAS